MITKIDPANQNPNFFRSKITVLLFSFSLGSLVFAAPAPQKTWPPNPDCSEIDLRAPGFSMEHVPIHNQGDLGVCFAHSATAAIEAALKSRRVVGNDFHASVFSSFVNYQARDQYKKTQDFDIQLLEGGRACEVVKQAKKDGMCNDSKLEGIFRDPESTPHALQFLKKTLEVLKSTKDIVQSTISTQSKLHEDLKNNLKRRAQLSFENLKKSNFDLRQLSQEEEKLIDILESNDIETENPTHNRSELKKSLSDLHSKRKTIETNLKKSFPDLLLDPDLPPRPKNLKVIHGYLYSQPRICEKITQAQKMNGFLFDVHKAIAQENPLMYLRYIIQEACQKISLPSDLALTQCIATTNKNDYSKAINSEFGKGRSALPLGISYLPSVFKGLEPHPNSTVGHASLIVGRKTIGGSCHYLVRNSWGNDCTYVKDPDLVCDKNDIWVPENKLFLSTSRIDTFFSASP